jgi:FAD dependent oxidoreductase
LRRRTFLKCIPLFPCSPGAMVRPIAPRSQELGADIVILGGGLGGCAAALAAARSGRRVILTEETDWVGGQLTAQAVPPDEHPWIESQGATRLYRQFRTAVRTHYRQHYPLAATAQAAHELNPGNGLVSRLCCEPRAALAVLRELLAPHTSSRRILLFTRHQPAAADVDGDRVRAVTVRDLEGGIDRVLTARYFLDATELGDLLPLTRTEYAVGAESHRDTGELHAPAQPRPANQQAFTCCFAMDYLAGDDHTIDRPAEYNFWREYLPKMNPPWPGRLLSWDTSDPITHKKRKLSFDPAGPGMDGLNLWLYRRIADRKNFREGAYPSDICLVNWPQNDYWLGNLIDVGPEQAARHLGRAKQLSLALFYWLQTEAPRPDGKTGWKGLRLRPDVVGTADGLARYPYVRESRRIRAEFTVLEQHVGVEARRQAISQKGQDVTAAFFRDSVGVGSYRIDLHPSSGGDNYIDIASLPFQIPLSALIPRRVENLLPACKNLGVTHITNGCYRLHPVEWNIGEAAGALAAFCLERGEPPRQLRNNPKLLADFQASLCRQGFELEWRH